MRGRLRRAWPAGRGVAVRARATRGGWPRSGSGWARCWRRGWPAGPTRSWPPSPPALFRPISFLRLLDADALARGRGHAPGARPRPRPCWPRSACCTRVTLPLAWLAALPLVAMTSSLGKIVHNDVLLLLCLVPLLPSPAGAAWSLDARLRPRGPPGAGVRAGRCGPPWWWWPGPTSSPAWPSCCTPARPGWPAATSAGCCTPPATASPSPTGSPCSSPTGRCSPTWSRRPPWP